MGEGGRRSTGRGGEGGVDADDEGDGGRSSRGISQTPDDEDVETRYMSIQQVTRGYSVVADRGHGRAPSPSLPTKTNTHTHLQ